MNIIIVIQDVKTKEYYSRRRVDKGFNANISEATDFGNEESALEEIRQEYLEAVFKNRVLEIKKYFTI